LAKRVNCPWKVSRKVADLAVAVCLTRSISAMPFLVVLAVVDLSR